MRILLIGAAGQLGGDLVRNNPGHFVLAPPRSELDVTQQDAVDAAIRSAKVDWVINTAAFHNVLLCEENPAEAFAVNCVAVRNLALACRNYDARFMTFSTDYVFNGEKRSPYLEDDMPAPLQIYGVSKLGGEAISLAVAPSHTVVVRTCGLYGQSGAQSKGGNFVDKRVAEGRRCESLDMASEQTVSPTSTEDLSKAIYALMEHSGLKSQVYHLVNEGHCSWHQFTKAIFENLGLKTQVSPVDRSGQSGAMRRPLYSVLSNTRARELGIELPTWQDALKRYLRAKYLA